MTPTGGGPVGRTGKAQTPTPVMNEMGKSDKPIVPMKRPNKAAKAAAEVVEGRGEAKGNATKRNVDRTQSRSSPTHSELDRVRSRAKKDKEARFTALCHRITVEPLRKAFKQLKRNAAPGVDGMT